ERPGSLTIFHRAKFQVWDLETWTADLEDYDPLVRTLRDYNGWRVGFEEPEFTAWLEAVQEAHDRQLTRPPINEDELPTGTAGRPTKGIHLIEAEFKRRVDADICEPNLKAEAKALHTWYGTEKPKAPQPTVKTIENKIRKPYRDWKNKHKLKG